MSVILGLGDGVGTIEEKSYDFFEWFLANVYGAVDAIGRLGPIHFPDADLPGLRFCSISEFDAEQIPAENHGHAVIRIAVPGRGFARSEPLPPDENIFAVMENLLIFSEFHA